MIYERNNNDPIYSTVPGRLGSVTEISDLTGRIKFRYVDAQTGHWYSPRRFAHLFNPRPDVVEAVSALGGWWR